MVSWFLYRHVTDKKYNKSQVSWYFVLDKVQKGMTTDL